MIIENRRSNCAEFKEYIQVKLIQDFGMNGSFIKNEEYFIPPSIDIATVPDTKLNGATKADLIEWKVYEDEVKDSLGITIHSS